MPNVDSDPILPTLFQLKMIRPAVIVIVMTIYWGLSLITPVKALTRATGIILALLARAING